MALIFQWFSSTGLGKIHASAKAGDGLATAGALGILAMLVILETWPTRWAALLTSCLCAMGAGLSIAVLDFSY